MSKVIIDIDEKQYSYEYFLDEKVCRFCWNKEAERDIIALIPNKSCNNQFVDKIKDCLGINLNENSFPKKACNSCYYKIEEYYEFKYFCQKTDKRLSELTKLNTNKFILHCNVKTESVDSYECDNNKNGDILDISQNVKDERDCEISQNNIKTDYSELNESKILISDVSIDFEIDEDGNDNELAETAKQKKDKNKKLSYLKSLDIQSSCYRQCFQKGSSKKEVLLKFKNKRYKPKRSPTYCNICCLDLETKEQLAVHNATHHGIEGGNLFKCFGCEKRFKTRKARLAHEVNFCKGLKEGYKCIKCDRFLPKRSMYEAHMRDHREHLEVELPENIFQCAKCYKLFKTKLCLTEHMAEHEALKKNYVCESCGRVFTRQDYLHKHRLTHTGTKQHACPHCGYRTAQRSSLTVHIRKHTGDRPYSCDLCPQRCISSSNLRAHRRRHLGDKSFECTICNKKFGYKISLEEHVASVHEHSQSFPCNICGALYTRARGLRRHLLAKHEKQKVDKIQPSTISGEIISTNQSRDGASGKREQNVYSKLVDNIEEKKVTLRENDVYEIKGGEDFVILNSESGVILTKMY